MNKKSIFITGAANGIGKETARLFASKGWIVGSFDINQEDLADLKSEFEESMFHSYVGDVCNFDEIVKALKDFVSHNHGELHVLFNNAGILRAGEFENLALSEQHRIIDVNIKGVINGTYAALPYLKETKNSHILSMCSASAFFGNPELTTYAASKAAVKSLTEGWSTAFKKYGITVSDLQPIYVNTKLINTIYDQFSGLGAQNVSLTPEKIAEYAWKAIHRNKLHWPIGFDTKIFRFLLRLFPDNINQWAMKKIIKYD